MEAVISKAEHDKEIAQRDGKINALRHELEQLKRLIFSARSEKFRPTDLVSAEQLGLDFGELQGSTAETNKQDSKEKITYERRKKKPHLGRTKLPDNLPVKEILLEPKQSTEGLVKIGEEITDTLDYRPGKLVIIRRIRPKYALPQTDGSTTVLVAELPRRPIDKGIPEPGLLAEICVAKYVDHLPFYRQIKRFERDFGWIVHKSTIDGWFAATCSLLEPLYQAVLKNVIQTDYLQVDESTIKVLDWDKKGKTHLGYHWVYRNPLSGLILFDYRKGRGANGVMERLANFEGYLQTDGYKAYQTYLKKHPKVNGVSCLAHIRRKFFEALDNHPRLAGIALAAIGYIYHIDAHCRRRKRTPQQRLALRRRLSLPVYEALLDWVKYEQANNLSKGAIGKALHYAKNELPKLKACFQNGRIELDNNLIENSIRPLALGRKNYLFAGSHQGAKRAAIMYSFFASCQKLDVNPREWLADVLHRISDQPINQINLLLPHNWKKDH
jgi:transposase